DYGAATYRPRFVSIDGSGATLSVEGDSADDPMSLDYQRDTGLFTVATELGTQYYNPASTEFGNEYTLTTLDGSVYHVTADTGRIPTSTDPNGNVTDYVSHINAGNAHVTFTVLDGGGLRVTVAVDDNHAHDRSVFYAIDSETNNLVGVSAPVIGDERSMTP